MIYLLTNFNDILTYIGLFQTRRLGNLVYCTFISAFLMQLFLKMFFYPLLYRKQIICKQIYFTVRGKPDNCYHLMQFKIILVHNFFRRWGLTSMQGIHSMYSKTRQQTVFTDDEQVEIVWNPKKRYSHRRVNIFHLVEQILTSQNITELLSEYSFQNTAWKMYHQMLTLLSL